ncbi:unnamed protein product [Diamesa tonsa]
MAEGEAVQVEVANGENKEEVIQAADLTNQDRDIIRQIEYYFGDANLRRDKFLMGKIAEDEEGWVPISVLLTFKRLKQLSDDAKVITDAVDKSKVGLVQVSADREKLRRHPENVLPEFNEERRKEIQSRTAYAKGFPLTTDMTPLIEFFNGFEKVVNVSMRKYYCQKDKKYLSKGSVFVTFETREQCEEFVKKPRVQFEEKDLIRLLQTDYFELKKQERQKKDKNKKKSAKVEAPEPDVVLPKGSVVHFAGVKDELLAREDIKSKISEIESSLEIAFVNFNKGESEGFIRFTKENDAQKIVDKLADSKMTVKENELTLRLVDGEEEEKFLEKAVQDMKDRRVHSKKFTRGRDGGHRGGGRGGRNNFNSNRKRRNDDDGGDEPSKKVSRPSDISAE